MIITAAIILWYTIETARIRRDAEARSARERLPQVDFSVALHDNHPIQFPPGVDPGQLAAVVAARPMRLRFLLANYSPNPAIARVHLRLRFGDRLGRFPGENAYGGVMEWQVAPFFNINGVFDLLDLVRDALQGDDLGQWPDHSILVAQLDLYSPDRHLFSSVAKEYAVWLDRSARQIMVWPEVRTTIDLVPSPQVLPQEEQDRAV